MPDPSNFMIATDLDGTFLNKAGQTVPRNLDAVAHFCAHGGLFTINTGRAHTTTRSSVAMAERVFNAPAALCNGAYLYDFQTGRFLCEEFIPPSDVADILEFCRTRYPDVGLRAILREQILVYAPREIVRSRVFGYEQGIVVFDLPVQHWPTESWYKLVCVSTSERVAEMRRDLTAVFGDRFGITSSSANVLEIQLPHSSKAVGLEKMRNVSPEMAARTVIACGDFENDIPMLKAAYIAVCPANAMDEVKEICDLVLCHCDEGVIADVIEHIKTGKIRPKQK